jgi:hypothetical protein
MHTRSHRPGRTIAVLQRWRRVTPRPCRTNPLPASGPLPVPHRVPTGAASRGRAAWVARRVAQASLDVALQARARRVRVASPTRSTQNVACASTASIRLFALNSPATHPARESTIAGDREGATPHFFRLKSTLTTFEPSSAGCAIGSSFSAGSCPPGPSPGPSCAWKRSSKLTAGSWNPVIAE